MDTDGSDALGFELYRRTIAQGGVQAVLVVKIDVAAQGRAQGPFAGEGLAVYMSDFIDLFHDSMCALSVMRRGRLTLCISAALAKACLNREDRNSTPRSLCTTVPGGGFRWRTAARNARQVSCADFSVPSAHPSSRRECRSITVAR